MAVKHLLCAGLVLLSAIAAPVASASEPTHTSNIVYGAYVSPQKTDTVKLAPILIYQNGRFKKPYNAFDEDIAEDARFEERYLKTGTALNLLYNNKALAEVTLEGRARQDSTPTPHAALSGKVVSNKPVLDFFVKSNVYQQFWFLATSKPQPASFLLPLSDEEKPAESQVLTPLAVSAWEKSVLQFMAQRIFEKKGLKRWALNKVVTADVKKRFLSPKETKPALFGTFTLTTFFPSDQAHPTIKRVLFIMAIPTPNGYKPALVDYKVNPPNVPYLVDALDLTGDGISELIVEYPDNEDTEFGLYKRHKGAWKKVYTGGGAGHIFTIHP